MSQRPSSIRTWDDPTKRTHTKLRLLGQPMQFTKAFILFGSRIDRPLPTQRECFTRFTEAFLGYSKALEY